MNVFSVTASASWIERESSLSTEEDFIRFQGAYVQNLIDQTDYPNFDIEGVNKLFLDWEHHKQGNFMSFRDVSYRYVLCL